MNSHPNEHGLDALCDAGVQLDEAPSLSSLLARLEASDDPAERERIALAPMMLRAAALRRALGDHKGFAAWRRAAKSHGVALSVWDEGVRHAERTLRDEVAASERVGPTPPPDEALALKRRAAPTGCAEYIDAFVAPGGASFEMEPGSLVVTEVRERAEGSSSRPRSRQLLNAAGRVLSVVEELALPDATPTVSCRVGFALDRGAPFAVDVRAEEFNAMRWVASATGMRVVLSAGRDVPDLVRLALNTTRQHAPTERRHAYLGWIHEHGRWLKLHAGGAIDGAGGVRGVDVRVSSRLARYRLPPPPTGDDVREALQMLRELVSLTPSQAVLPVTAFVVRAMLGPGAGMCHLHGRASSGKSHLAAMALSLVGEFEGPRALPGEWERDTEKFTARVLAIAGDVPWGLDDWRPAIDPTGARFHGVARALFNMSGRGALSRDRGFNETPDPRGAGLSTGEATPVGGSWSALSRLLSVELPDRVALPGGIYAPGVDDDPREAFVTRAPSWLTAAGSWLVRWLAPQMDRWRDPRQPTARARLVAAEREALSRWGVRDSARAVDVIGPTALGAEVLVSFLDAHGVLSHALRAVLEQQIHDALDALRLARAETLDTWHPGRAWVASLAAQLRAGTCHVRMVQGNRMLSAAPPSARALGWRHRNGFFEEQGPCVGLRIDRYPDAICIDARVALDLLRREERRGGAVPEIHTPDHLARELVAADLLATRENDRRATVRPRVDGAQVPRLAVKLSAFDLVDAPEGASVDEDTD